MAKYKRFIYLGLVVFWMMLIYGFSNQDGVDSGGLSLKICQQLLRIFYPKYYSFDLASQESIMNVLQFFVRKLAHMSEYAILFMLSYLYLNEFHLSFPKICIIGLVFCFCFACADEYHQTFIDGRYGSPIDVMIDFTGAVGGNLFILILKKVFKH